MPALVVVNGHGGDRYSWYAFYSGVLYARGGAAVLTFDPIGEGERHAERRSGTRAHDRKLEPPEMAQRMGGQLVTDVLQAVAYLRSRSDVEPGRVGIMGYSLGSFLCAVAGAVDPALFACVPTGGGNLDGEGGYWDRSKPMCQGMPYQALRFLGDRPVALYALHACRGPTLIVNGTADSVVGIPTNMHDEAFFRDLQERTAKLKGDRAGLFEFLFVPNASHRPFFVTRPVALWLERQLDFPNWTEAEIRAMPETHIAPWARAHDVAVDKLYATEDREGGTQALGANVPALSREVLSVFSRDEWERQKGRLIYESWVEAGRARLRKAP
jgi:dienelactone hydrolase